MISDRDRTTLISSLGWVDHDALWRFDVASGRLDRIDLASGAWHLSLQPSGESRFCVGHHFDGTRFEMTVHAFTDPAQVLARAVVMDGEQRWEGDASVWEGGPLLLVAYLGFAP